MTRDSETFFGHGIEPLPFIKVDEIDRHLGLMNMLSSSHNQNDSENLAIARTKES